MVTYMKKIFKKILPLPILEEPFFFLNSSKYKFDKLKNKFNGQRCFILGNGPSLNKINLSYLKNEKSFAVNGIFYKTEETGYRPTFYVVEDQHVMKDNLHEIKEFQPQKSGYRFFSSRYRYQIPQDKNTLFINLNRGFYEPKSPYYEIPRFSSDASYRIYCGQSVTIMNLQLAFWLGFKDVYMVGMDFNYDIPNSAKIDGNVIESTEDDVNHFHPDYFGKGKKWHDPKLNNVMKNFQLCKLMYELDGRNIYNATVGGKLELFERVDYQSLFDK